MKKSSEESRGRRRRSGIKARGREGKRRTKVGREKEERQ